VRVRRLPTNHQSLQNPCRRCEITALARQVSPAPSSISRSNCGYLCPRYSGTALRMSNTTARSPDRLCHPACSAMWYQSRLWPLCCAESQTGLYQGLASRLKVHQLLSGRDHGHKALTCQQRIVGVRHRYSPAAADRRGAG
jgi:hypothetical protein